MRGYSYILNPEAKNSIVETVVDYSFLKCVVDNYSRTGSNMLMEYDDNGYTYVVFSMRVDNSPGCGYTVNEI